MKKMLFGCVLMLCGVIGAVGMSVAFNAGGTNLSVTFAVFNAGSDYVCFAFFILIAVVGAYIAIREYRR